MTIITFGKYNGKTTEELRRIDPQYLRWGARELRSATWRAAFAAAAAKVTLEDEAVVIAREDGIDFYEALQLVRDQAAEEAEQQREAQERKAKEAAILSRYASQLNRPVEQLRRLSVQFVADWDEQPASRFSSAEAHAAFCAMMQELEAIQ
jgi:hypothetical protein